MGSGVVPAQYGHLKWIVFRVRNTKNFAPTSTSEYISGSQNGRDAHSMSSKPETLRVTAQAEGDTTYYDTHLAISVDREVSPLQLHIVRCPFC